MADRPARAARSAVHAAVRAHGEDGYRPFLAELRSTFLSGGELPAR